MDDRQIKPGFSVKIIAVEKESKTDHCKGCIFGNGLSCSISTLERIGIVDCDNVIFKIEK